MLIDEFLCKREVLGKRAPHSFTPPSKCGRCVQHQQVFIVGAHTLTIYIEDIYFLTGLSRCGSYCSLSGSRRGGLKMSEYCNQYCVPEVERQKGKVAIWGVTDITLRTILFTIARMAGSAAPHMDLQSYF
jgi:hypothetical protein